MSNDHPSFLRESDLQVKAALARAEGGAPAAASGERAPLWHHHEGPNGLYAVAEPEAVFVALEADIGIPLSMRDRSFGNFELISPKHESLARFAFEWAAKLPEACKTDKNHSLLLTGPEGTGKTHLAIAALRGAVRHGYRPRFYCVEDLLSDLHSNAWNNAACRRAIECEVALFDDLGGSRGSKAQLELLQLILRKRYDNRRPSIITTRFLFPSREIKAHLGDRMMSRIQYGFAFIPCEKLTDFRKRGGA